VPETPNRTDMKKRKLRGNKKAPLADPKQTAEAAVLSYARNGGLKIWSFPEKRKGELPRLKCFHNGIILIVICFQ